MLERIKRITSLGLFADIRPSAHPFRKVSLLYADNGRGKSTLAALMKSYGQNEPALLTNRKTIGATLPQCAELQFSQGNQATFSQGAWKGQFAATHVFDLDFVDTSVYTGGEINAGHRKKLLNFALGASAVGAMQAFNQATANATEKVKLRKTAEDNLQRFKGTRTTAAYVKITKSETLESDIASVEEQIRQAENSGAIRNRKKFQNQARFTADLTEIINIFGKTHAELSSTAQQAVNEQIKAVHEEGFRSWAHTGLKFIKNDCCPFCTQKLKGIDLIDYYRECFDDAFNALMGDVAKLDELKRNILAGLNLPLIQSRIEQTGSVKDDWSKELKLDVENPDIPELEALHKDLDFLLSELVTAKKSSPLTLPSSDFAERLEQIVKAINTPLDRYNTTVVEENHRIDQFLANLTQYSLPQLRAALTELKAIETRFTKEVTTLVGQYVKAKADEKQAQDEKDTKRETLNALMKQTLGPYEQEINRLLNNFGARFQIKEISYNYNGGGDPKSDYAIELRGEKLALSGEATSFKTSLSEGDKRTLAFAFFIAVVMKDADLNKKIVVVDDPMCSLDRNRRSHTINVLKKIYDGSLQLIVMAHDIHFLKTLRDEFVKKKVPPQEMSTCRLTYAAGDHSDFSTLDIDRECESAYYSNHRLLSEYVSGTGDPTQERNVAIAIRPLLEGYLHRRYPGHLTSGMLFGEIVRQIEIAQPSTPLSHAQVLVNELNEINSYAGKYHHDTNTDAETEMVITAELHIYSRRALGVIYGGQVS